MNANATKVINEILDHFQNNGEKPSDNWDFDDEFSSMCLDHQSSDGAKFWIDIERDGTIHILWKAAGADKPQVVIFVSQSKAHE